jgi:hypothetical protein
MNEKREKPITDNKKTPATGSNSTQPPKKPYSRPVLVVIGKIGQIFSDN